MFVTVIIVIIVMFVIIVITIRQRGRQARQGQGALGWLRGDRQSRRKLELIVKSGCGVAEN